MIQVCSQCGTRWNVRDRQRSWCPRCGGTLLAPSAPQQQWAAPTAAPVRPDSARTPPRLAPGYRWIAVRPGAAPRGRRQRKSLGPTPRYRTIPHWGLQQHFDVEDRGPAAERHGPDVGTVRAMLILAMVTLGIAAFAHVVRYALLLINRSMLLHPVIAWAGVLFGLLASLAVLLFLGITVVLLVSWLIARRTEAYAQRGQVDPRSPRELWLCCLVPGVNLLMAPIFVLELATLEARLSQLRRPIVVWWIFWALSAVVAVWSIVGTVAATFIVDNPQNIADNTVTTTIGYLLALVALLLLAKVFFAFERSPTVERSVRRWVVVGTENASETPEPDRERGGEQQDQRESAVPVEPEGHNPAA
ncbi:DUF4328 domain-containing protein [Mycolicibacterium sp. XJ870]